MIPLHLDRSFSSDVRAFSPDLNFTDPLEGTSVYIPKPGRYSPFGFVGAKAPIHR